MANDVAAKGALHSLEKLLRALTELALNRTNPAARCGGLLAMSHCAVELGKFKQGQQQLQGQQQQQQQQQPPLVDRYSEQLLQPILTSINDPNNAIKKAALDALYNCIKVMKVTPCFSPTEERYTQILSCPLNQAGVQLHFTELFTVLSGASMELDQDLKLSVEMCDRVLKDALVMCGSGPGGVDADAFVAAARERLPADDPFARMFHLGWVSTMQELRHTSLVGRLDHVLDGVLVCLGDSNRDIQTA